MLWLEVNDKYCDIVCVFWCGDEGVMLDFVIWLMGLRDVFYKGY